MARRKTAFDSYAKGRAAASSAFSNELEAARTEVDQTDAIIRALDEARVDLGMSKAELARAIGARPDTLRRLLTSADANPTLRTVALLCEALGLQLSVRAKPAA